MYWFIIFIFLCIGLFLIGNYFVESAQNIEKSRKKKNKKSEKKDLPEYAPGIRCKNVSSWFDAFESKEELYITSNINTRLHASLLMNDKKTNQYIIVLHGYKRDSRRMGSFIHQFYLMGYNVLAVDARSHGLSEGSYTAMGYLERKDIVSWINLLIKRDPECKIVLYGLSMGAATVMFTLQEKLPVQVVAAIEDCGYNSVWEEFKSELKKKYHVPAFPVLYAAELVSKIKIGFTYREASTINAVSRAKIPMLFIHGDKDDFVPTRMVYDVYHAHAHKKELLIVPEAIHAEASTCQPVLYWNTVDRFIKQYID